MYGSKFREVFFIYAIAATVGVYSPSVVPKDLKTKFTRAVIKDVAGEVDEMLREADEELRQRLLTEASRITYTTESYARGKKVHVSVYSPLEYAARYNCAEVVKILLRYGVACAYSDDTGRTALHVAAKRADPPLLTLLLEKCDAKCREIENKKGLTALFVAIESKKIDNVRKLLEYEANVRAVNSVTMETALHAAAKSGRAEIFDILWGKADGDDWNVNAVERNGLTPLMVAARNGRVDAMKSLLRRNADTNLACTSLGYTALHYAVLEKKAGAVKILLDSKAATYVKSEDYETPLELAQRLMNPHHEIVKALRGHEGGKNWLITGFAKSNFRLPRRMCR